MYESVLQGALGLPQELKEELVDVLRAAILEDACAARDGVERGPPPSVHGMRPRPSAASRGSATPARAWRPSAACASRARTCSPGRRRSSTDPCRRDPTGDRALATSLALAGP